jgi:hypothetical protein
MGRSSWACSTQLGGVFQATGEPGRELHVDGFLSPGGEGGSVGDFQAAQGNSEVTFAGQHKFWGVSRGGEGEEGAQDLGDELDLSQEAGGGGYRGRGHS